ncbi:MAG: hypothetical protein PHW60_15615 [Kiritimatiellae bacterium]|nr:hypothetical protein [Kiritimatiellia bacterium]
MSFPDYTHGVWCNAKLWRSKCRHCSRAIFVFVCDCDCRVLLEGSNGQLSLHECRPDLHLFSERDLAGIAQDITAQAGLDIAPGMNLRSSRSLPGAAVRVLTEEKHLAKIIAAGWNLTPVQISFLLQPRAGHTA